MKTDTKTLKEITGEIESLPKGAITYKVIRGKRRMYLQWTEEGKRRSKYIRKEDEAFILSQMDRKHFLEESLRRHTYVAEAPSSYEAFSSDPWVTSVTTGSELEPLIRTAASYQKRDCYEQLRHYLGSDETGRVFILYGLRRTGKTTLLFQAIAGLPHDKTAYIKVSSKNSMDDLISDLKYLLRHGFKYVFIDEVTLLSDFISTASLLSDIYAQSGMKIVLSGTDSLGFEFSSDDELYDRAITVHTTFIPFREYSRLLGIHDIDEYIRYGGTLRAADTDASGKASSPHDRSFEDVESARKYIDTSIAHNIQHSLINYRHGSHMDFILELFEANELTSAVNRIIEDMNHRFVLSVLTRDWTSHDLGSAGQLLKKKALEEGIPDPLAGIDTEAVTEKLKNDLDILNKNEMSIDLSADHVLGIKAYLRLLDLIADCPSEWSDWRKPTEHIIFTQPGMRYCQAKALVSSLMEDPYFSVLSPEERKLLLDTILQDIRGRMLEDIVLFETSQVLPRNSRAFKLRFNVGEIDMVIYDKDSLTCRLFEVKHSDKTDPLQYRHLIDEDKTAAIEHKYGRIISRTVLYRGRSCTIKDGDNIIEYINVEDYLENL